MKSQPIGKDSDAGKNGRQKEMGKQKVRQLDNITDSMDVNLSKFRERECRTEEPGVLRSAGLQRAGHGLVTEQQRQLGIAMCVYVCVYFGIH